MLPPQARVTSRPARPRAASVLAAGALAALLAAAPANAATRFRFSEDTGIAGTGWRDGARCRVELDPRSKPGTEGPDPGAHLLYDVVLEESGRRLYVDTAGKTWWQASEHPDKLPSWETRRGLPPSMPGTTASRIVEPTVKLIEDAYSEPVAGHSTRKFVIRFRWVTELDYPGEVVRIVTAGTWILWSTGELEEGPCVIDPGGYRTGTAEIDSRIEAKLAAIPGVLLQRQLALTSRIEGGVSDTVLETLTVEEIGPATAPASGFTVPDGYRHQAPRFASPGVIDRGGFGDSPGGR